MIKPDVMGAKNDGKVLERLAYEGFEVVECETLELSTERAQEFYAEHNGRPFFESLVRFMSGGQVIALKLQRTNAIAKWRSIMGPTKTRTSSERVSELHPCIVRHGHYT